MLSFHCYRNVILAGSILLGSGTYAKTYASAAPSLTHGTSERSAPELITGSTFDALLRDSNPIAVSDLGGARAALWSKYKDAVSHDKARVQAVESKVLKDGDKSMRFSLMTKGEKPANGYPLYIALHGGGGGPASTNDSQWKQMQTYYFDSIDTGIYVATRGITDTWKLHWEDASFRLYDQLIENLLALKDVDPNRIYIMGFSAGGDGVYQITPRMADRFAAANMSAGHHNWIKFDNLFATPFLMQVGENDSAYSRNKVTAENSIELDRLQALRGGYIHDAFIHSKGSHNSWSDRDASGTAYPIIAQPAEWLKSASTTTISKDTAAAHWLRNYTRNPYPAKLVWDPKTNAPRDVNGGAAYLQDPGLKTGLVAPQNLFYWLDLGAKPNLEQDLVIEAECVPGSNKVSLKGLGSLDHITVLLSEEMVDFNQDISVSVEGIDIGVGRASPNVNVMTRSLLERGDSSFIFQAELNMIKNSDGTWAVAP